MKNMKWIAISGSWRITNKQIEEDVRSAVRAIIKRGDGIVSGGAINVDYFATDEALQIDPVASRVKIFLPTTLHLYAAHYRKRASEGVITKRQAEDLISQLETIKRSNPDALIEDARNTLVDRTTYFQRNSQIVDAADELFAFQVNKSAGVQDAIDKARARNKPATVRSYTI
jgi:hypothetical protein